MAPHTQHVTFRHVSVSRMAVAVLGACAVYEAGVALGWIALGSAPGDGPTGGGVVLLAAIVAMLAGIVGVVRGGASALPPLVAAAFVVARFYSYDPYYAPGLRRMSDGGAVSSTWIFFLVAIACLAALFAVSGRTAVTASRTAGRGAASLAVPAAWPTVVSLLLDAVTALVVGVGH